MNPDTYDIRETITKRRFEERRETVSRLELHVTAHRARSWTFGNMNLSVGGPKSDTDAGDSQRRIRRLDLDSRCAAKQTKQWALDWTSIAAAA